MKIFIGTLILILGIIGVLLQATENLPPEFDVPILNTIVLILGILIIGLGWQDELEGGKTSIIDIVKKFFSSDPFRLLGLNVLIAVANQIITSGIFSKTAVMLAQAFLAIAAVFGFGAAYASYKLKLFKAKNKT
jgi:hypothetical protein